MKPGDKLTCKYPRYLFKPLKTYTILHVSEHWVIVSLGTEYEILNNAQYFTKLETPGKFEDDYIWNYFCTPSETRKLKLINLSKKFRKNVNI